MFCYLKLNCWHTKIQTAPYVAKAFRYPKHIYKHVDIMGNSLLRESEIINPNQLSKKRQHFVVFFGTKHNHTQKLNDIHNFFLEPESCVSWLCPPSINRANTISNHWAKNISTLWDSHSSAVLQSLLGLPARIKGKLCKAWQPSPLFETLWVVQCDLHITEVPTLNREDLFPIADWP